MFDPSGSAVHRLRFPERDELNTIRPVWGETARIQIASKPVREMAQRDPFREDKRDRYERLSVLDERAYECPTIGRHAWLRVFADSSRQTLRHAVVRTANQRSRSTPLGFAA